VYYIYTITKIKNKVIMSKFESSRELTLYFKEVESSSHPLTKEEESTLIPLAQSGDSQAIERVVNSCAKMVVKTANRYMGQGVPVIDLVQEGNIGTIEALKRFTPGKAKFASYAQLWIKKYINDSVATVGRMIRIPMSHEFEIFKAKKAGEEVDDLRNNVLSLDQKLDDEGSTTYADVFNYCQPDVDNIHHDEFVKNLVEVYLNKISRDKDKEILKAYFGIEREYALSGEMMAQEFSMSKVGISKVINRSLNTLRETV
jgi:RNA polymerase primary sigma factor